MNSRTKGVAGRARMSMGRIEQIGKPSDIRARPATPFVREFITA